MGAITELRAEAVLLPLYLCQVQRGRQSKAREKKKKKKIEKYKRKILFRRRNLEVQVNEKIQDWKTKKKKTHRL